MTWEAASGRRDGSDLLPGVTLEGPRRRGRGSELRRQRPEFKELRCLVATEQGSREEGDTGMKPGDCHGAAACEEGAQR